LLPSTSVTAADEMMAMAMMNISGGNSQSWPNQFICKADIFSSSATDMTVNN
jgi:hypothetical protein